MKRKRLTLWMTVAVLGSSTVALGQSAATNVSGSGQVRQLIESKCLGCHDSTQHKGGLDLTRRANALKGGKSGPAIVEKKPEESLLLARVSDGEMPPSKPLEPEQVGWLEHWVLEGAPYEIEPFNAPRASLDWWSLQPILSRPIPMRAGTSRPTTPIDAFVLEKLGVAGLTPAPEADRNTLVRRITLDLTGLPPTPEEVAAFASDERPDAYERLVERLLASPAYGERWGRHWLDVARFAESHGYETNALRPNAWPYRDWVIRAWNEDLPFAEFAKRQFAGDLMEGDWLSKSATGFLVGGTHDVVGNQTTEGMRQQRADDLDDVIAATGQAFLGLSVQCARCHDHKFDPISQQDYYALKAVFAGLEHADRDLPAPDYEARRGERLLATARLHELELQLDQFEPLARPDLGRAGRGPVNPQRNVERFNPVPAKWIRFTVQATNNGIEPCLDELEIWSAESTPRNLAPASLGTRAAASSTYPDSDIHRLEHINDGRYGNGHSWISASMGKGNIQLELRDVALIDRIVWGRDREAKFVDRTATEYYIEVATVPGEWRVVASSADRTAWRAEGAAPVDEQTLGLDAETRARRSATLAELATIRERLASLSDTISVYAGRFRAPDEVRLLRRGDVMQESEPARAGVLSNVTPALLIDPELTEQQRRAALADWICDPRNPLPARVMVNRLWQYHFGQGLVATSGDFGFNGEKPSHPELLDWLAARYQENGWQIKPIQRLIVLSSAYRQCSAPNERAQAVDSQNRLLWRFTPRRLEAEALRDAMLATSGTIDRRMGGPGYWIWEPNTNYVVVFNPLNDLGTDHARRMVYQYKPRSQQDITFGAFDCPDSGFVTTRRNNSTTALQALNMLNSRFVLSQARALSERLKRDAGEDVDSQVARGFWLAFGRAPTERERDAARGLIHQTGSLAFCRALYNASEFLTLP